MGLIGIIILYLTVTAKLIGVKSAPKPQDADDNEEVDIWKETPEDIFSGVHSWKDEYPGQITIRIKRDAPGNLAPLPLTSGHQTDGYHTSSQSGSQSGSSQRQTSRTRYEDRSTGVHYSGSRSSSGGAQGSHSNANSSVMYDAIRQRHWPTGGSQVGSGGSVSSERHYVTTNSGSGSQYNPRGYSGVHSERRVGYPYANAGSIPYGAGGSAPYTTSGFNYYSAGNQRPHTPLRRTSTSNTRGGYGPIQTQGQGSVYVPNPQSMSNDPNCPTSDFRLVVNGMECPEAIDTLGAFICYNYERASRACCEKCLSLKETNKIGCEYGDKSYQCKNIEPFDCYVQRNRDICCETCERFRTQHSGGTLGCEFGDLTPRCQTVLQRPHLCYMPENQRLCCVTCPRLGTQDNSDCQWGDQNPDLCQPFDARGALRINCYQSSVQQVCCSTCERLASRIRHPVAGCEHGDRPVTFSTPSGTLDCGEYIRQYGVEHCDSPDVAQYCCYTCQRYRRGTK